MSAGDIRLPVGRHPPNRPVQPRGGPPPAVPGPRNVRPARYLGCMTVIDTGPLDEGNLDESTAAEHIHGICLKTGPPRRVGVELEWLGPAGPDPAPPVSARGDAAPAA